MFILSAKRVGADAVKIQIFKAKHFPKAEQAAKRVVEFPRDRISYFIEAAHDAGLDAGASVFDREAIQLCSEMDWLKLAAREQDNSMLCASVYTSGKKVFQSFSDIRQAQIFRRATPLYTISKYPTSLPQAIAWLLRVAFYWSGCSSEWGWSSHTRSIWDCVLAARLGASVIEKHFALTRYDPEAGHSLYPRDFARMVDWCRRK